jgi:hypothetical protein
MRCMLCGTEMHLVATDPAEAEMGPGFNYQTFECGSCQDIERRLTFAREPKLRSVPLPTQRPEDAAPPASAGPSASPLSEAARLFVAKAMATAAALARSSELAEAEEPSKVPRDAETRGSYVAVTRKQQTAAERSWEALPRRRALRSTLSGFQLPAVR